MEGEKGARRGEYNYDMIMAYQTSRRERGGC